MGTNYGEVCLIEESSVSGSPIKNHLQDILIPFPAHSVPASVKYKVLILIESDMFKGALVLGL
jgi:hypothetical protein